MNDIQKQAILRDTKEHVRKVYLQSEKQQMLGDQHGSPYFFRCDVLFDGESDVSTVYFGKFPFLPEAIYSRVATLCKG